MDSTLVITIKKPIILEKQGRKERMTMARKLDVGRRADTAHRKTPNYVHRVALKISPRRAVSLMQELI